MTSLVEFRDDFGERLERLRKNVLLLEQLLAEEPKPRRARKPTLATIAKQASKAGIQVIRYEVGPDGKIAIVTGTSDAETTGNPWDEVLRHGRH